MTFNIPIETSNPLTPPAPEWVRVAATDPATVKAAGDYDAAVQAVNDARQARTAATLAFREASILTRDGYVPARGLLIDEWRVLQTTQDDANRAMWPAESAAKRAWHTYADALADDPGAEAAVVAANAERHAAATEAVDTALSALTAFAESDALAPPSAKATINGPIRLAELLREARSVLNPEPQWTTTRSPEAQALVDGMRK